MSMSARLRHDEQEAVRLLAREDHDEAALWEDALQEGGATNDYLDRLRLAAAWILKLVEAADERRDEIRRQRQDEAYAEANYGDSRPDCP